jgi:hypothetical protein
VPSDMSSCAASSLLGHRTLGFVENRRFSVARTAGVVYAVAAVIPLLSVTVRRLPQHPSQPASRLEVILGERVPVARPGPGGAR